MEEGKRNMFLKFMLKLGLLLILYFMYIQEVITKYNDKLTNTARYEDKVDFVDMTTVSICTGFNSLIFEKYGIDNGVFNYQPESDLLPKNYTVHEIYRELTYTLNKDFKLNARDFGYLQLGMNKHSNKSILVKQLNSALRGICYALIPSKVNLAKF